MSTKSINISIISYLVNSNKNQTIILEIIEYFNSFSKIKKILKTKLDSNDVCMLL